METEVSESQLRRGLQRHVTFCRSILDNDLHEKEFILIRNCRTSTSHIAVEATQSFNSGWSDDA